MRDLISPLRSLKKIQNFMISSDEEEPEPEIDFGDDGESG